MSALIKEIIDLARFLWRTPAQEKQIVFYAEHGGYYPSFEGLLDELTSRHGQRVSYITSAVNDPILSSPPAGVNPFYIFKFLPFLMGFINCRVFVMTLTDLNQFHLRRSMHPVHYVYVFHAMVSTHLMYRFGAFDYYDSILTVGPHQINEIRKHETMQQLPAKELVSAGYYRLERVYQSYQSYRKKHPEGNPKPVILIAPSWGKGNVLEACGEALVRVLLDCDYKVIVRPHPETVRRNADLIKRLKDAYSGHADFVLETSVASDHSMLISDVLICDCSGIALEYAFGTERPVLFLDTPIKIQNSRYKELGIIPLELDLRSKMGVLLPTDKLKACPAVIAELLTEKDEYRQRLSALRHQCVFSFNRASEIGAEHILKKVAG